ncbi:helix-turn-helix domain-containing protein [Actinomadura madurae]|uniref:helix-turn-helix domain-containing protein n=1 Tax=Actinomadura madurae TaxID=1993 RepID=UPI0020D21717|nr:helix-turn-helix transcriptional regulator [Actinomadura madurae]MCP9966440.1 helix-turn-helix transcriptional regulator [Actinomadura madurae]MCP9978930.1 helix-turn-helix transcriptional regulator [Actinomadura madurae]MCQ0009542.1 helix-turn-helix transcriptional regulator [Actinomadura madurae]
MTYRPTVRGRRLARELRKLREEQGLTLQEVADRLDWSRATVSRLETSQTRPKPGDIADILDLYGVPSPDRDALITLARQAASAAGGRPTRTSSRAATSRWRTRRPTSARGTRSSCTGCCRPSRTPAP